MTKIIAVDLDDTLCVRPSGMEHLGLEKYKYCKPIEENIKKINILYDEGNKIIVYTARGMSHFNGNVHNIYSNLYTVTERQLNLWGVKYHQLIMGKIHYDMLIDDKCMRPDEL